MAWIPLAMAAVGAVSGARQAEAKRAQQNKFNQIQSEMTRYSPWTGVSGTLDNSYHPDVLSGGVGGGLQGLAASQSLTGMFKGSSTPGGGITPPADPSAPNSQNSFSNIFGGQNYSNQMGQQGNGFAPQMDDSNSMWPQLQNPSLYANNGR